MAKHGATVALCGIDGGVAVDPARVLAAAEALAAGRLVVLVDGTTDAAHLVASGVVATTNALATMGAYGRGVLRVALPAERIDQLGLPALGDDGLHGPVDLAGSDRAASHRGRAATVRALADASIGPDAFTRPGHVFPVRTDAAGSLGRPAVAEAAADLALIVSRSSTAAYTAAVDETGAPAGAEAGARLANQLGLELVTVDAVVAYREAVEPSVERVVGIDLPTRDGRLSVVGFRSLRREREYTAFVRGSLERRTTRVHVHQTCRPADVFGGGSCGCGPALDEARSEIARLDDGIVLHIEHPAAFRHVLATGEDTTLPGLEVDVAHVLRLLCVRRAVLSSNEPLDLARITACGLSARPADAAVDRAPRAVRSVG